MFIKTVYQNYLVISVRVASADIETKSGRMTEGVPTNNKGDEKQDQFASQEVCISPFIYFPPPCESGFNVSGKTCTRLYKGLEQDQYSSRRSLGHIDDVLGIQ